MLIVGDSEPRVFGGTALASRFGLSGASASREPAVSDERKKRKFAEKRERRRKKRLAEERERWGGDKLPVGAVRADKSKQVPNNSYSPPEYYVDVEFTCIDCGREEVWTAAQQKWYYEVAKGSLYATAVRCRACRRKHRENKGKIVQRRP